MRLYKSADSTLEPLLTMAGIAKGEDKHYMSLNFATGGVLDENQHGSLGKSKFTHSIQV